MADPVRAIRFARVGADAVGQLAAIVGAADPGLAAALHGEGIRPFATRAAGEWREIVTLDDRLARAVLAGAHALGLAPEVRAMVTPADVRGPAARRFLVTHRSPCHYRTAGGAGKARLPVICPDVERMLAGLAARWTDWTGEALPAVNARAIGVELRAFARASWPIAGGRRIDGFTGELALDLTRLDAEQAAAAATLLRFGAWRGVGAHTTYGMGWIAVEAG